MRYLNILIFCLFILAGCGGGGSSGDGGSADSGGSTGGGTSASDQSASLIDSSSAQSWYESLPADVKSRILYYADHEEGNLYDWDRGGIDSGSGVYITDSANASASADTSYAHSGSYSAKAEIRNAVRAENDVKAVRLMVWTDKPWEDGGSYFPDTAYYSVWIYFPHNYNSNKYAPWDPGDGGWWNIFQFKSDDSGGVSQPMWVLNAAYSDSNREMYFYLYSDYNTPASYEASPYIAIPVGKWVHVEAKYVQSSGNDGEITVWQDGVELFSATGIKTILSGNAVWGVGNYTDHVDGGEALGEAELYFDDACVSEVPLREYAN